MRVAFFAHLPFHGPILAPVHDAVGARAECLFTSDRGRVTAFAPDVLVMASHAELEYFRTHLPHAHAVNVRHGMIGKSRKRKRRLRGTELVAEVDQARVQRMLGRR